MLRIARAALFIALATSASSCAASPAERRYSREAAQAALSQLESPGLLIGEFALAPAAVVDGDTIKVKGLDTSLRLLALDTEETFKRESDRRAAEAGFDAYLAAKRGDKARPIKAGTPLGMDAKRFAEEFFAGAEVVRLERDHPKDLRGRFNRYLAYVFVQKNGKWSNYNLEAVRAGMSPYFTKYGYSRRFDREFREAEAEARRKELGIWRPGAKAYPDYDERRAWWNARADFIKAFERDAAGRSDMISLNHWDALQQIGALKGQEVTILAAVGDVRYGDSGPSRVLLSRRLFSDFPVIFFDRDVFASSGIAAAAGEFVRVTGVVNEYENKYNHKRELQLLVNLPSQVVTSIPAAKASGDAEPSPPAPRSETHALRTP